MLNGKAVGGGSVSSSSASSSNSESEAPALDTASRPEENAVLATEKLDNPDAAATSSSESSSSSDDASASANTDSNDNPAGNDLRAHIAAVRK